jgi:hypothetical protein
MAPAKKRQAPDGLAKGGMHMSNPKDETVPGVVLAEREPVPDTDDEDTRVDPQQVDAVATGLSDASSDLNNLLGDLNKMKKGRLPF